MGGETHFFAGRQSRRLAAKSGMHERRDSRACEWNRLLFDISSGWARTHLVQAGLLDRATRSFASRSARISVLRDPCATRYSVSAAQLPRFRDFGKPPAHSVIVSAQSGHRDHGSGASRSLIGAKRRTAVSSVSPHSRSESDHRITSYRRFRRYRTSASAGGPLWAALGRRQDGVGIRSGRFPCRRPRSRGPLSSAGS